MDFQLLAERPDRPSLLTELEFLVLGRRGFWQRRLPNPPFILAGLIFLIVTLELTINTRLLNAAGFSRSFFSQWVLMAVVLLGIELVLAAVTTQAATLFGVTGTTPALLAYLNLGLFPLVIYLPVSLLTWLSGYGEMLRMVLLLLLLIQVLAHWREAIELTYKTSRMQSAIIIYVMAGISFLVLAISSYILIFNKIADLL